MSPVKRERARGGFTDGRNEVKSGLRAGRADRAITRR